MPALSQKQQKLMGLALAVKRGQIPASKVNKSIEQLAKSMTEKDIEKFAATKHIVSRGPHVLNSTDGPRVHDPAR